VQTEGQKEGSTIFERRRGQAGTRTTKPAESASKTFSLLHSLLSDPTKEEVKSRSMGRDMHSDLQEGEQNEFYFSVHSFELHTRTLVFAIGASLVNSFASVHGQSSSFARACVRSFVCEWHKSHHSSLTHSLSILLLLHAESRAEQSRALQGINPHSFIHSFIH